MRSPFGNARSAAVLGVVLLGAALRLVPIWFGFPLLRARPDEETAMQHAAAVLGGDLNPHFFHWPSFIFYLFAAVFGAASGLRRVLLLDPALSPSAQYVVARGVVALAGTATVYVVFVMGRRIAGTAAGLLGAAFLAVAILHVRESHFAMTDVVMTLFVTLALMWLLEVIDAAEAAIARWCAAGIAAGFAAGTKYSAAAVLAAMAAAQLLWACQAGRVRRDRWLPAAAFVAAFAGAFLLSTPFALLDHRAFLEAFAFDLRHLAAGHTIDVGPAWRYHLLRTLPYGAGLPTMAAAIVGVVPAIRRYPRQMFVLGAFAVSFYLSIGSGHTAFFRYALPLVPVVCIVAAIGVISVAAVAAARLRVRDTAVVAALGATVAAPSLANCIWFDALLARTDTRVVAASWVLQHVRPEQTMYEHPGGYARLDLDDARWFHRWAYDPASNSFFDPLGGTPDWLVFEESPLTAYASVPPTLQTLAREKYVLVYLLRATKGSPANAPGQPIYDEQDAFFLPINGFQSVRRPGPTVLVYRRANLPAD